MLDGPLGQPEKYTPQFGGYCAFGVVHGSKLNVDPQVWEIVDGRLYFLINAGTKSIWTRNKISYIRYGARAWKIISDSK
ncbi:MAG: YHS domain-containing (seleno)protein [Alphaproteobacteria bacterium]